MNARKLPSGSWRARATAIIDGKRVYKSFTADTKEDASESDSKTDDGDKVIKVGACVTPHAEILAEIKDDKRFRAVLRV